MSLNARNSDPRTSHSAADEDILKRRDRMTVWALFKRERRPLADFMVDELLGGPNNGKWRKRRSDLSRDGWLYSVGEINCPHSGRAQILWAMDPTPPKQGDLFGA